MDKRRSILEFVMKFNQGHELRYDEDLFQTEIISSMFAIQLVVFVEQTWQIRIEDDEMELDNFRSVDAIASLIERKGG